MCLFGDNLITSEGVLVFSALRGILKLLQRPTQSLNVEPQQQSLKLRP